ncbi:glycosyltransferase [Rufibacter ruber]|uniref:glycosyltransferase n=1 Tax=Rufibacter ruber TaxID=1783499 RepID=UPI0008376BAD|nr:glycosyltransferase family 4 protein [Rufibacter ruber]
MAKDSLLFLSPVLPNANGSGREKRAHQWLMLLSQKYTVQWLVITYSQELADAAQLLPHTQAVLLQYPRWKRWAQLLQTVLSFLVGPVKGAFLLEWMPLRQPQKDALRPIYQDQDFAKILAFRLYTSEYAFFLQQLTNTPLVELDLDDIESSTFLKTSRILLKGKLYKKAFLKFVASHQFRLFENQYLKKFDKVYLCSREDRKLLEQRLPAATGAVFPNRMYGKTNSFGKPDQVQRLLFVGSLDHYPNEEAVRWFIEQVLIPLREQDRKWELQVVGYGVSEKLEEHLVNQPGVLFSGPVPDLGPVYAQAGIVVAPLHAGGGTKLKVLEAMWHGRPVVATQEAAYGLGIATGTHYLLAETPAEYIQQCVKLATDSVVYSQIIAAAAQVAKEKFSYHAEHLPEIWE